MLNAYINPGNSPLSIDENIFRAQLTRTAPPTEEQIAAVQSKAMTMLQEMDLGEWEINRCYVRSLGETIFEHVICIDAVPVINNVAAAQQPQMSSIMDEFTNRLLLKIRFATAPTPKTTIPIPNETITLCFLSEILEKKIYATIISRK